MIARLFTAATSFAAGFFTLAAVTDGVNGWVPDHLGLALFFTAIAALTVALD